jgi:hypothetical protein
MRRDFSTSETGASLGQSAAKTRSERSYALSDWLTTQNYDLTNWGKWLGTPRGSRSWSSDCKTAAQITATGRFAWVSMSRH